MLAVWQRQYFDGTTALLADRFDLRHRSVLIFNALNGENGAMDSRQILFDVPAAEAGMQPDVVPSPERARGISVMARKKFGEVGGFESGFGFGDAANTKFFNKNVRREQGQSAQGIVRSGVNDGNRGTVTVTCQNRVSDTECREQCRQGIESFVVHVADSARFGQNVGVS